MQFCKNCGEKVSGNSAYCGKCGQKLSEDNSVTESDNIDNTKKVRSKKFFWKIIIATIIVIIALAVSYKPIMYNININKAKTETSPSAQIIYCIKAMEYSEKTEAVDLLNKYLSSASMDSVVKVGQYTMDKNGALGENRYKTLMIDINLRKAHLELSGDLEKSLSFFDQAKKYGYNLTDDQNYVDVVNKVAFTYVYNVPEGITDQDKKNYYSVGDLDNDGILEFAVASEINNYTQTGENGIGDVELSEYKYVDGKYQLNSKFKIPETDGVYKVTIGKVDKNTNAIFLEAIIGVHSGKPYIFTDKHNKLESILSAKVIDDKVFSLYPGEAKDINNDGIFEISTISIDPSSVDTSSAGSDKIVKWYQWNGKDNLNSVKIEHVKN